MGCRGQEGRGQESYSVSFNAQGSPTVKNHLAHMSAVPKLRLVDTSRNTQAIGLRLSPPLPLPILMMEERWIQALWCQ